jgi:CubicO group peptidase (beta-lactamase class C family)
MLAGFLLSAFCATLTPDARGEAPAAPLSPVDTAGLTAFVDGAVAEAMMQEHIAGVAVSIVDPEKVLLSKGYGIAALAPLRTLTPQTLTRVGSLSKVIVSIAIMQLVEQHLVTLDDPINMHLPGALKIPDQGFSQPILIRHLLSHTAGFEDTILGHLAVADPHRELPAETYLARYRPRRVRAPGTIAVYSNYDWALAGMIVAHVSRMRWEDYAEQRILRPLGMRSATFRENIPRDIAAARGLPDPMAADAAATLSRGFQWKDARLEEAPTEYITHFSPAGALSSTAQDMALLLQAFLDPRRFESAGVLKADTVQAILTPSFSNAAGFGTIYHGLSQFPFPNGQLAIGKDGDTRYQHSIMLMIPAMRLGIFVGTNTDDGLPLIKSLPYQIGAYLLGSPHRHDIPPAPSSNADARIAGHYLALRRPYFRSERAILNLHRTSVQAAANGDLLVSGLAPDVVRYSRENSDTYREVDGPTQIAFRHEGNRLLLLDPYGADPLERVGFFAGTAWLTLIFILTHLLAIAGTVQAVRDLREGRTGAAPWSRIWGTVPCLWLVALLLAWIALAPWLSDFDALVIQYPGFLFPCACWLFFAAALLTLAMLLAILVKRPAWRPVRWVRVLFSAAVFLSCAATFHYWGILGFSGW